MTETEGLPPKPLGDEGGLGAAQLHPDTDEALFVDRQGPAFPPPWLDEATRDRLLADADLTPEPDDPHDHTATPEAPDGG